MAFSSKTARTRNIHKKDDVFSRQKKKTVLTVLSMNLKRTVFNVASRVQYEVLLNCIIPLLTD